MPKRISDIDWGVGFGRPWNYEAEELAKRVTIEGYKPTDVEWALIEAWADAKVEGMKNQMADPIAWGWRLRGMEKLLEYLPKSKVLVAFGGNRSSKSETEAKIAVHVAKEIPDAVISCWSQNDELSVQVLQDKVWKNLPHEAYGQEIKTSEKTKGSDFSLTFSQKNGFSDGKLILPPMHPLQMKGSEIRFKTYSQYQNDRQVAESYDSDLEIMDEEPPFELFKTLRQRINDRSGKLFWGCTLIKGYGELAAWVLDGAEVIEERYAPLVGKKLPYVMKSKNVEGCYVVFLHTEDNPFINLEDFRSGVRTLSEEERMVRAYGFPSKRSLTKFPRLNANVHIWDDTKEGNTTKDSKAGDVVIGADDMIKIPDDSKCTHYMSCDPAGEKRWAMIWYKVDPYGVVWVEREWPDLTNYGSWALPATSNQTNKYRGSPGPAQEVGNDAGMGYATYARLIKGLDSGKPIYLRIIDPRGNKTIQGSGDEAVTVIGEMALHSIFFTKALGPNDIDPGIQKINDYLEYDNGLSLSRTNRPKLMIHRRCGNLWSCLQMYNGMGGPDENAKDFVDVLRYALMSNPVCLSAKGIGPQPVRRY